MKQDRLAPMSMKGSFRNRSSRDRPPMRLGKSGGWGESIHRTGHGQVGLRITLPIDPPRRAQCQGFGPARQTSKEALDGIVDVDREMSIHMY